ncbi:MAG: 50S ribosomal protein L9 [Gammaproteobacteria bacterium]
MKVILLEDVPNLGALGDIVRVKPGYARNYLFPQGKSERVTPEAQVRFDARRAELEKRQADAVKQLKAMREKINGTTLQVSARAGPDGKLYGSVTAAMIAAALNKTGDADIRRGQVSLPSGALRTVGEHPANIALGKDVDAAITIAVVADDKVDNGDGENVAAATAASADKEVK